MVKAWILPSSERRNEGHQRNRSSGDKEEDREEEGQGGETLINDGKIAS